VHDESKEIAANSELTGVHIVQATRKACPFPSEILERLRKVSDSIQNGEQAAR